MNTVAVHRADAVAVAIGGESGIVAAFARGALQRLDVRLDWLGMDAAEKRVARCREFHRTPRRAV